MDVCVVRYHSDESRIVPGLRAHDSLVVHDNTHRNIGFAAGANAAAHQGSGSLICFVNPDGDLTNECLDRLEAAFLDPGVVAVNPDIGIWNLPLDEGGQPLYLSGCCLVVRRRAFEELGGFDERFFMYGEDVDLSWRLRKLGRLKRIEDAHYAHDQSKRRPFRAEHRVFRNWHVIYKRHEGAARVSQSVRDAFWDLRSGHAAQGLARLTGVIDYILRGRRLV